MNTAIQSLSARFLVVLVLVIERGKSGPRMRDENKDEDERT